MAIRSLKETYRRMVEEKKMSGQAADNFSDLRSLENRLAVMYRYRNNELQDSDSNTEDDSPGRIENICSEHYYSSFSDYQNKHGLKYSLSIGDLNDAMDGMSYCTCNGRQIEGCNCVARYYGDVCNCDVRNPIECTCRARDGGKYDPECYCNTRYSGCSCVSRTQSVDCDCHGRCSCNIVNEFTMSVPAAECSCVAREAGDECLCHVRTTAVVTPCDCQARSAVSCPNDGNQWASGYCGRHAAPTHKNACLCNSRNAQDEFSYCSCVSRTASVQCGYHVKDY